MALQGLGKKIKHYRQKKNWLQEDLAEHTDLSVNYIGMLERDEKTPKLITFVRIANTLGVSADELLADNLDKGYQVKMSIYTEKIGKLPAADQKRIYKVLDSLLENS